jgi:hypothetical protein
VIEEFRESIRLDISAATRDREIGEWKGATVLAGSAVEALLLWALQDAEKRQPGCPQSALGILVASGTVGKPQSNSPDSWDLHEYTEIAAHVTLIHPGVAQRKSQKCDQAAALAATHFVVRDLTPP